MAVPGHDPRHRRQPRLRLHRPGPARRSATRHPARTRTRPLRTHPPRTRRIPATTIIRRAAGRADQREPVAVLADVLEPRRRRTVRLRDPAAQPGQRRPPRHPARDLDRRNPTPPATTATASWSRPRCHPATASRCRTRPGGCTAPCTPPNWPAWTPPRSSAPPSPPGTWPDPATSPPSSMPGSARASTRWFPSRKAPGPGGSPSCPTPTGAPTWPRSPR